MQMQKRTVTGSTIGTYWIWEMPEIAREIPTLLSQAGEAEVTGKTLLGVDVEVQLAQPAKVIDWRWQQGDGVAINSDTYACIGQRPSIRVHSLPKNGDKEVNLFIDLELHTFKEGDTVSLNDMRQALKDFAAQMTRTWYYHFKK